MKEAHTATLGGCNQANDPTGETHVTQSTISKRDVIVNPDSKKKSSTPGHRFHRLSGADRLVFDIDFKAIPGESANHPREGAV